MIEGRVAQVLNERELIINRGLAHGVSRGMKFEVLASEPLKVVDPEDGTDLGEVDRAKVKVRASSVHDRFAICETYETTTIPGGAMNLDFSLARMFEKPRVVTATLKADDAAFPPPLPETESFVKVGDRVRLIEQVGDRTQPEPIAAAS